MKIELLPGEVLFSTFFTETGTKKLTTKMEN